MSYFNILFLDIETVGMSPDFDSLDERWQQLWSKKAQFLIQQNPDRSAESFYRDRAAIYSEFGRVVCISFGFLYDEGGTLSFKVKSFADKDEKKVLEAFGHFVETYYGDLGRQKLCGHNIREFDIPYLCRRMARHQIPLPSAFQLHGKKPWEVKHLVDTLELWKFGDYKHFTSLDLLSAHLGIPTPKSDIDGSQVHATFYDEDDLDRIRIYCERDVVTTARVYLRMMHQTDFNVENVTYVTESMD